MSKAQITTVHYKVMDRHVLARIVEEKDQEIDTFYIIDYNAVFVTIFKDETAVLLPPVLGGEEGLLFYNLQSMHEMIASRSYPVKGTGSFWEKEKVRIEICNYLCRTIAQCCQNVWILM